jgi:hypothetical protein
MAVAHCHVVTLLEGYFCLTFSLPPSLFSRCSSLPPSLFSRCSSLPPSLFSRCSSLPPSLPPSLAASLLPCYLPTHVASPAAITGISQLPNQASALLSHPLASPQHDMEYVSLSCFHQLLPLLAHLPTSPQHDVGLWYVSPHPSPPALTTIRSYLAATRRCLFNTALAHSTSCRCRFCVILTSHPHHVP